MSLPLFIYLAGMVDPLSKLFVIIAFLSGLVFGGSVLGILLEEEDNLIQKLKFGLKTSIPVLIFTSLLSIAIPSKDTMYLMAGGYAAQEIAASEVGDKVKIIINQELDKLIENQK